MLYIYLHKPNIHTCPECFFRSLCFTMSHIQWTMIMKNMNFHKQNLIIFGRILKSIIIMILFIGKGKFRKRKLNLKNFSQGIFAKNFFQKPKKTKIDPIDNFKFFYIFPLLAFLQNHFFFSNQIFSFSFLLFFFSFLSTSNFSLTKWKKINHHLSTLHSSLTPFFSLNYFQCFLLTFSEIINEFKQL